MEEINPQTNYTTKAFYTAEEFKRLEQENAELKEKLEKYGKINEQETKDYAELLKNTNKYKHALEEIREILEKSCKQCKNEYLSEDYCSGQGDCYEIRQIINEVLGNENNSK